MDNLNIKIIRKELDTSFIGKNIIYLKKIDSTNNYASKLIKEKKEKFKNNIEEINKLNGLLIIAETQTKGRGRFDRIWLSPPGGLWFSIILLPQIKLIDLSKITILAAASVFEILSKEYIKNDLLKDLFIKWPNDIYYKNKKLAGILSEAEKVNNTTFLILGIGININCSFTNASFKKNQGNKIFNAVSMQEILGVKINRNVILSKILSSIEKNYIFFINSRDFKSIFNKIEKKLIY